MWGTTHMYACIYVYTHTYTDTYIYMYTLLNKDRPQVYGSYPVEEDKMTQRVKRIQRLKA